MKKLTLIFFFMLALLSCMKNWEQLPSPTQVSAMDELKVNKNFNWSLNQEISIDGNFLAGGDAVQVTSTDRKIVFYTGYADGKPIRLNIPSWHDDVLINGLSYNGMKSEKNTPLKSGLNFSYDQPITFVNSATHLQAGVRISDDTFLLFYVNGNQNNALYYMVGVINGSNIDFGPARSIGVNGATMLRVVKYDTDKVLIAYTSSTNGNNNRVYMMKATFTGGQLSNIYGTYATDPVYHFDIAAFSDKKAVIAYVLQGSNVLYARMIDLTDFVPLSMGIPQGIASMQSYSTYMIHVTALDNNRFFIGNYLANNGKPYFANVSRSGLTINPQYTQMEISATTTSQRSSAILKISDTRVLFFYYKGNDTYCRFGNITGNTVDLAQENLILNTQLKNIGVSVIDQDNIHLCATNPLDAYRLNFAHAIVSGESVSFAPFYSTTIAYNFNYYTQYPPITNFSMGNNTHLIIACNAQSNRYGLAFLGHHQPLVVDTDHDGIADIDDAYPTDPLRAFDNYYPATGFGSLAYEDLWPGKGDYDFNDLVIDYQFHSVTNAQNHVVDITARFVSKASGASLENGFGFQLSDAAPSLMSDLANIQVSGTKLTEGIISTSPTGFESGQSKPTIIVFDNVFNQMQNPGYGIGVNTQQEAEFVPFDTTTIQIIPSSSTHLLSAFAIESWNPFLIVNLVRQHEIHLIDNPLTDLGSENYFGQWEDASNPAQGSTYKTVSNLPWAIDIPASFEWPLEKTDITQAHVKFAEWAQSGGAFYSDWYLDLAGYRNNTKLYQLP